MKLLAHAHIRAAAIAASLLISAFGTKTASGALPTTLLPADRQIEWQGNVGIAGGIPTITTIYKTLSPSGGNDLTQIQNALVSCPANQVVKLTAGTFVMNGVLDYQSIGNSKILRGTGLGATILRWDNSGSIACILMRSNYSSSAVSTGVDLASDAVKGTNTVSLSSAPSWLKAGQLYAIDQLDDPTFVTAGSTAIFETGVDFRYDFVTTSYGHRGLSQLVRVLSVSGNTATLEVPLYYGFKKSQTARLWESAYDPLGSGARTRCGIEDLTIRGNFTQIDTHMIKMENCDSCWIKNVESDTVPGLDHVIAIYSYRCEIRDSYFHGGRVFSAGQAYGVALYNSSCANLIENNIFQGLHASMQVNYGSSGNVYGYNYAIQGRADSGSDPSISFHGTHTYMNLFEGNYCQMPAEGDVVHGSSSHNVLFRNRIEGIRSNSDNDETAVEIDYYNRNYCIVGNVLGVDGMHTVYERANGASCTETSTRAVFKIGYRNPWGCDANPSDTLAVNNVLRHGNYDSAHGAVTWDPTIADHTIPPSLYLAGKPTWWGSSAWPAIGSDLTPMFTKIPAQLRFAGIGLAPDGNPSGANLSNPQ